jgi:uncharacterized membrane protein YtjA (UPF0391 family)
MSSSSFRKQKTFKIFFAVVAAGNMKFIIRIFPGYGPARASANEGPTGTFFKSKCFTRGGRSECAAPPRSDREDFTMLGWAVTFLIVALIAGLLGFAGVAIVSVEIAKIVFFVAIILFLISAIFGFMRGRPTPMP